MEQEDVGMLVWSLEMMSTPTLGFDMEKVPLRANDPHVTEVVVPAEPFEFPLKETFDKWNHRRVEEWRQP